MQINIPKKKPSIESPNKISTSIPFEVPKRTIKAKSLRSENTKDTFTNEIASPNHFKVQDCMIQIPEPMGYINH